tara:strand:- start:920 stop:1375 length:456 start_codon:yes stop_codon:yes gene_type:complete
MIAEIATVVSVIKGLNDAISTIKESKGHAGDLASIMGRYATANEAVQDVESKYVGRLSVKDSMQIQLAKRQLKAFNQQLKDSMMMQGLTKDYNEIMTRVEESRLEHERQLRIAKIRRRKNLIFLKQMGVAATAAIIGFGVILGTIMLIFKK